MHSLQVEPHLSNPPECSLLVTYARQLDEDDAKWLVTRLRDKLFKISKIRNKVSHKDAISTDDLKRYSESYPRPKKGILVRLSAVYT